MTTRYADLTTTVICGRKMWILDRGKQVWVHHNPFLAGWYFVGQALVDGDDEANKDFLAVLCSAKIEALTPMSFRLEKLWDADLADEDAAFSFDRSPDGIYA